MDIFKDIINEFETFLYKAFIDIPQMRGENINNYHDIIYDIIIDHLKATHKEYLIDEEE